MWPERSNLGQQELCVSCFVTALASGSHKEEAGGCAVVPWSSAAICVTERDAKTQRRWQCSWNSGSEMHVSEMHTFWKLKCSFLPSESKCCYCPCSHSQFGRDSKQGRMWEWSPGEGLQSWFLYLFIFSFSVHCRTHATL